MLYKYTEMYSLYFEKMYSLSYNDSFTNDYMTIFWGIITRKSCNKVFVYY